MSNIPPATGGGGQLIQPQQPPKDPIVILVLNLIVAGCLGYFMIGQKMKGIVALVVWLILIIPTCGAGSGLISVVTAIDGFMQAQNLQAGHPIAEWTFFKDHR
jgi:hypothetical protein